ncbi:dihydrofolate reductase [Arcanobacterium hippocoleae]|nr:dihydrofolate reductase [Arcanobacterium hippocoleae]
MIWAQGHNRIIGKNGALPWHLPADLALFKQVTAGNPVLMGRKTWDSLPPKVRPLPQRVNYVLTRDPNFHAAGAVVGNQLEKLLSRAGSENPDKILWVMGGAQIYAQTLAYADVLLVTDVDYAVDRDASASEMAQVENNKKFAQVGSAQYAYAPDFGLDWDLCVASPNRGWHTSADGIQYRFSLYANKSFRMSQRDLAAGRAFRTETSVRGATLADTATSTETKNEIRQAAGKDAEIGRKLQVSQLITRLQDIFEHIQ